MIYCLRIMLIIYPTDDVFQSGPVAFKGLKQKVVSLLPHQFSKTKIDVLRKVHSENHSGWLKYVKEQVYYDDLYSLKTNNY